MQDTEGRFVHLRSRQGALALARQGKQEDAIGDLVKEQGTHVGGSAQLELFALLGAELVVLEKDDGIGQPLVPEFVYQSAEFARAVGMVALCHNHHLGMLSQAGFHLIAEGGKREEEELYAGRARADGHQYIGRIGGVRSFLARPG